MGKATACPLKHAPSFEDARDAIALQCLARSFLPGVYHKGAAIYSGNFFRDA